MSSPPVPTGWTLIVAEYFFPLNCPEVVLENQPYDTPGFHGEEDTFQVDVSL